MMLGPPDGESVHSARSAAWKIKIFSNDELRLTHAGQSLSKRNLRGCYLGTPWKAAVDRAKALAQARGVAARQAICRDEPGAKMDAETWRNSGGRVLGITARGGTVATARAAAYAAGLTRHGATVHFVDEGIDTDPIILQRAYEVEPGTAFDRFKALGLALEHRLYLDAVTYLFTEKRAP